MPNLNFKIVSAQALKGTPVPTLGFHLEITNDLTNEEIQETDLDCRAWIKLSQSEKAEGSTETSPQVNWEVVTVPVKPFKKRTFVMILFACPEDIGEAIDQYMPVLEDGIIPITFSFSGSLVYRKAGNQPEVFQLPPDQLVDLKMPVSVWRNLKTTYSQDKRKFSTASKVSL